MRVSRHAIRWICGHRCRCAACRQQNGPDVMNTSHAASSQHEGDESSASTDRRQRLHREPLGTQIAAQLREDILLGRLPAGTQISQQQLCEEYGTSRMPVRDAVRALTHEGLIVSSGSGPSSVAPLTDDDIEDSYYIEGLVHSRAARRAAAKATPSDVAQLRDLHEQMQRAEAEGNLRLVADLNWQFHRLINLLADSPRIRAFMRTVSISIPRDYLLEIPEWASRANREHAEIIAAIEARRLDEVEGLVREHVESAGTNLIEYLHRRGLLASRADAGPGARANART